MQRELGGEVGNRLALQFGAIDLAPCARFRARRILVSNNAVVRGEPTRISDRAFERLWWQQLQHADRVVRGLPPHVVVQTPEDAAGIWRPAPPEIAGERIVSID